MKTKLVEMRQGNSFQEWLRKIVNFLLAPLYFFGAHWYDAFCGYISNEYNLASAFLIMFVFLTTLSVVLIYGHEKVEKRFGWDLMGLEEFKGGLKQKAIPWWRIFKQLKRFATKSRKTSFWLGNMLIGPPIISILLRRENRWQENMKYIIAGSAVSVVVWVPGWAIFGYFTWEQYIKPFFKNLTA